MASHHCLCSESETSTSNLLRVPKLPSDGTQNYMQKEMCIIIRKKHDEYTATLTMNEDIKVKAGSKKNCKKFLNVF